MSLKRTKKEKRNLVVSVSSSSSSSSVKPRLGTREIERAETSRTEWEKQGRFKIGNCVLSPSSATKELPQQQKPRQKQLEQAVLPSEPANMKSLFKTKPRTPPDVVRQTRDLLLYAQRSSSSDSRESKREEKVSLPLPNPTLFGSLHIGWVRFDPVRMFGSGVCWNWRITYCVLVKDVVFFFFSILFAISFWDRDEIFFPSVKVERIIWPSYYGIARFLVLDGGFKLQ